MSRNILIDKNKPESLLILGLMDAAKCSQGDAFLAFFRVVGWMTEELSKGYIYTSRRAIDDIARLPGMADALERAGILVFSKRGKAFFFADSPRLFLKVKRAWLKEAAEIEAEETAAKPSGNGSPVGDTTTTAKRKAKTKRTRKAVTK